MAWVDLGVGLALVALLVWRRRGRLAFRAALLGLLATAVAIHCGLSIATYRGSSGIAAALFVAAAFELMRHSGSRSLAITALFLFVIKTVWETLSGEAFAAGPLPPGVTVQPLVHLAGGLAGALAAWMEGRKRSPLPGEL
jgi:hypothetical protein